MPNFSYWHCLWTPVWGRADGQYIERPMPWNGFMRSPPPRTFDNIRGNGAVALCKYHIVAPLGKPFKREKSMFPRVFSENAGCLLTAPWSSVNTAKNLATRLLSTGYLILPDQDRHNTTSTTD